MEKTRHGTDIVAKAASTVTGCTVILTRRTTKDGAIKHGVVMESPNGFGHRRVGTFLGLEPAFRVYKALRV